MPHLRILTNVEKERFDEAFLKQLSKDMAVANEKPEKVFILISILMFLMLHPFLFKVG